MGLRAFQSDSGQVALALRFGQLRFLRGQIVASGLQITLGQAVARIEVFLIFRVSHRLVLETQARGRKKRENEKQQQFTLPEV